MAFVSVVGFATTAVAGGLVFDTSSSTSVGSMWLAALPVVAVGAPFGAWLAHRITETRLTQLIISLAAAEVVSTVLFVPELRSAEGVVAVIMIAAVASVAFFVGLPVAKRWVDAEPSRPPRSFVRGELVLSEGSVR